MVQYLPDDHGVFDTCNHLRATTAGPAGLNVNIEHPFQSLSPYHRRRKDTMVSGQIDSGFGYQGGQFGDEIYWLEDDVSRPITIRGFQFIANQALFG